MKSPHSKLSQLFFSENYKVNFVVLCVCFPVEDQRRFLPCIWRSRSSTSFNLDFSYSICPCQASCSSTTSDLSRNRVSSILTQNLHFNKISRQSVERIHQHMHIHTYSHTCACIYVYICVCICTPVYTSTHVRVCAMHV